MTKLTTLLAASSLLALGACGQDGAPANNVQENAAANVAEPANVAAPGNETGAKPVEDTAADAPAAGDKPPADAADEGNEGTGDKPPAEGGNEQ